MSDQEIVQDEQVAEVGAPAEEVTPEASAEETAAPAGDVSTGQTPEPEVAAPESDASATEDDDSGTIFNLESRQELAGKVKNITPFGAFIDLGLPQDGLVHISELARKKVEKVEDVVNVGDEVTVWVKKVDRKRGRISLTMIKPVSLRIRDIEDDSELEGVVTRLEPYGAFVDIDSERDGLVHISQITHGYIKHPEESLEVGQKINVKVLKVNKKKRQVDLSIKALLPPPVVETTSPAASEKQSRKAEEIEEYIQDEEPVPTAMALAFASLQTDKDADDRAASERETTSESKKHRQEQDDIIARTLATSD
jgi:transcriptional accessory protein Tex/SPT6